MLGPNEWDTVTSERLVMGVITGPCHDSSSVLTVPHGAGVPGMPQRADGGQAGFLRRNRNSAGPAGMEKSKRHLVHLGNCK